MSKSERDAEPLTCISLESHRYSAHHVPAGPEGDSIGICWHKPRQVAAGVTKKRKARP